MIRTSLLVVGLVAHVLAVDVARATESAAASNLAGDLARLPIGFRLADSGRPESNSRPESNGRTSAASMNADARSTVATDASAPLPLAPRGRSNANASHKAPSAGRSLATVLSSLACVGALLLVVAWFVRRGPLAERRLPPEVFQHLGTAPLNSRQSIHVLRFGDKLLLVGGNATGLQPLSELTEPADVQRLADLCRPAGSRTISATLQRVVADWSREGERGPATTRANRASDRPAASPVRRGEASHA